MRRFFYLIFLLAAGALVSSCDWGIQIYRPTTPSLFVVNQNTERFEVGPEAQEQVVYISSDLLWYATLKDGSWCTLGEQSYYNEFTTSLTFRVQANNSTESRIDSLIVISGTETRKIAIVQNNVNSLIDTDEIELYSTLPVQYKFNAKGAWTVEQKGDWFTVSPDSYSTGNIVTFTAKEDNRNTQQREGSVTFKLGGLNLTIPVRQIITETVIVESNGVTLESQGGQFKIHTRTNVEYTVTSDAEWLQVLGTRALLEFDEYFNAEANMNNVSRTGHITFRYGDIIETVTVTQNAREAILDITTPGFYGIGRDYVYIKGQSQSSRLTNASGRSFRLIYPSSGLVLELKGVPVSLNIGEILNLTISAWQNGQRVISQAVQVKVVGEDDKLIWLKNSANTYFILKKQ
ncbi:MAG: BACON domain-containing protein [Bacteroidales bacterium]|nr:BACON domain-containing protein [Bacteroidales bacterium]